MRTKIPPYVTKNMIPVFCLGYGVYAALALQRNFHNIWLLKTYLFLIMPSFLLMNFILHRLPHQRSEIPVKSIRKILFYLGRSMPLTLSQYIFAFCLPCFWMTQSWIYFLITAALFMPTLWDPWWQKLLLHEWYRRILQLWAILSALSYLFPFFWPEQLSSFYVAMTFFGALTLLPNKLHSKTLKTSFLQIAVLGVMMLLVPRQLRFPVLSVWLKTPHFAFDVNSQSKGVIVQDSPMNVAQFLTQINEGKSFCCVAPIVAPQKVQEKVTQEWQLNGRLVERPTLNTAITGNIQQQAFHSYFCKRNFPVLTAGGVLRCRIYLSDKIYLGQTAVQFTF